jgi:hypothetical protein
VGLVDVFRNGEAEIEVDMGTIERPFSVFKVGG